jgi:hypothetical protein
MPTKEVADDCSSNNVQSKSGVEHEEEDGGVKIGIVKTLYEELAEIQLAKEMTEGGNIATIKEVHMHKKSDIDTKKGTDEGKLKFDNKKQGQEALDGAKGKGMVFGNSGVRILKRGEVID